KHQTHTAIHQRSIFNQNNLQIIEINSKFKTFGRLKMKNLFTLLICLATIASITALVIDDEDDTRNSPQAVSCPNTLCQDKGNGKYDYPSNRQYYIECNGGKATCYYKYQGNTEDSGR
uniref:Uncharacterized protein n=1 Tax=Clytia hemisphaerica TaxID=252671 RepID=A0A7M5USE9_9CNID